MRVNALEKMGGPEALQLQVMLCAQTFEFDNLRCSHNLTKSGHVLGNWS
ncbi:hypothetical protein S2091_0590 [Solimicrobium silvestre]|uniref:Uncharacterized protein n=1 Tax=Solimicrobium silvestre TaxID=2099400 RepID=A0A2S9H3P2_9BURK|nr:hypothetical protein S2091_0590 [Solimicrobium silvestre]